MADDIGFGTRPLPDMTPGERQRDRDTGRPGTHFYPNSPTPREKAVASQSEGVDDGSTKSGSPRVS
jgi:hypothetical protein